MHREVLMERLYYKALFYLFALISVLVVLLLVVGGIFSFIEFLAGMVTIWG